MNRDSELAILFVNGPLGPHVDCQVEAHAQESEELAGKIYRIFGQNGVGKPEEKVNQA